MWPWDGGSRWRHRNNAVNTSDVIARVNTGEQKSESGNSGIRPV